MDDIKIRNNQKKTIKTSPMSEFYTALDEIKELYISGYRVKKHLYEFLKDAKNWKMTYQTFNEYFKKEIEQKVINETKKETPKEELEQKEELQEQVKTNKAKKGLVWDEEQEEAMRDYMETVKRQEEANKKREQEEIERKNR